jgi:hypothetical protein
MVTEVFNRIGEAEIHSGNNFHKKEPEDNNFKAYDKIEFTSKPLSDAKKEFFKYLENDSLTIDACNRANHDWKKK